MSIVKQAAPFLMSVSFDINLNDVSSIDFVFAQTMIENAEILKQATWVNGDEDETAHRRDNKNIIDIPWSEADTFLFKRGEDFYMDTKIHFVGSDYVPITPIIPLKMAPSLFIPSNEEEIDD